MDARLLSAVAPKEAQITSLSLCLKVGRFSFASFPPNMTLYLIAKYIYILFGFMNFNFIVLGVLLTTTLLGFPLDRLLTFYSFVLS